MIGTRKEEVPMLVPTTETSIIANNQPAMTVSTGVINKPQVLKMPMMQEFIVDTTPYNTVANRTPRRVRRAGGDGSTPAVSGSVTSDVSRFPSPNPPYVCIWKGGISNKG